MAGHYVSHAQITRALEHLGERCGRHEVSEALLGGPEPFEAQMRRRMRTRPSRYRDAYRLLARAGADKVRLHLEEIGALSRSGQGARRRVGATVRVRRGAAARGARPGQPREVA
jgi:hypothetical protein